MSNAGDDETTARKIFADWQRSKRFRDSSARYHLVKRTAVTVNEVIEEG